MMMGHLDPRTKLILLILCVLCTMVAPSLTYELILVLIIAGIGVLLRKYKYTLISVIVYIGIYALTQYSIYNLTGMWQAILAAFLGLVNKVYPCGFMASLMILTTKTSESMAAFYRIHIPDSFTIPFAVMMRYIPVIKEDWHYIKDAMKMRDLAPNLKNIISHPLMTLECIYVPMMMAASKTADELSIAAVTRGIESPGPRTCLVKIQFTIKDVLVISFLGVYFGIGLLTRGGIL